MAEVITVGDKVTVVLHKKDQWGHYTYADVRVTHVHPDGITIDCEYLQPDAHTGFFKGCKPRFTYPEATYHYYVPTPPAPPAN